MELDLMTASAADCREKVEVNVERNGVCHGFLGWFDLHLGMNWLSTSPLAENMHWAQAFLPLDPPIDVSGGTRIEIEIIRPEHGDWTWTVKYGKTTQRHSTFLGKPLSPRELVRSKSTFKPMLSRKGEAARYLLSRMNGKHQVTALSEEVFEAFADVFLTFKEAERFVKNTVTNLSSG
jgi:hypothetical protein